VRVWDVESGRELVRFKGHAQPLWTGAFTPDGRRLAAGGDYAKVSLWAVPQ
jgi:WD40 repeat protein